MSLFASLARPALPAVLSALLAACGAESGGEAASQVVAKVNGREISVHQLNFFAKRVPDLPAGRTPEVRKQIVERLIDQEVLVQEAMAQKLDRDPATMLLLEASRREILARSLLEKVATQAGRPDAPEVGKFFAENPALFSGRRVFRFNEVNLPGVPPNWDQIEKPLAAVTTMAQAVEVLRAAGIELPIVSGVQRASEHLPVDVLAHMNTVKPGAIVIYRNAPRVVIAELVSVTPAPVVEKAAGPVIERFLVNQKRYEAVRDEMKRLRDIAQVVYVGEFDPASQAAAPAAEAPAAEAPAAEAPAAEASAAAVPARDTAAPAQQAQGGLDEADRKGLAGLR